MNNCYDTQRLSSDELHTLPHCINALQNSGGGKIILPDGQELIVPTAENIPVSLEGRVWRRVEGINIISGNWAKSVMANRGSIDDFPVNDDVDSRLIEDFCGKVIRLHPEFAGFSRSELLRRTGIFSGKYLTRAGSLMFGENLKISATLTHKRLHAKLSAKNIWEAYTEILPRITCRLSDKCSEAVGELIVNALLHADYSISNEITIAITSNPSRITITNPGFLANPKPHNRLTKLFRLSGISGTSHNGINTIKNYCPSFRLEQDMLDFRVIASLRLEGISAIIL